MRVVVFSAIWPETIERLRQQFDCQVALDPPEREKLDLLRTAEVVIVRSPVRLDRKSLEAAAYDRSPEKRHKVEAAERLAVRFLELDTLFSISDFVTIHAPLNETTAGLVDAALLARMKPTAFLVNVGRGGIVNEQALYVALKKGWLQGAALDVFQEEPPGNHPLLELDNLVATPHVAAQTDDAQRRVGEDVWRVIQGYAQGQDLSAASWTE